MATVLELPTFQAIAETQQGAIEQVRQLLTKRLAKAEIIPIQLENLQSQPENPILKFAGMFKDDPDFAEIVQEIRAEREQIDTDDA